MKAYFKKIAALTAAALLVLSMAACGGNDDAESTAPVDDTNSVVDNIPADDTNASDEDATGESDTAASNDTSDTAKTEDGTDKNTTSSNDVSKWSTAQIVEYYTKAANKVKTDKPALTKTFSQTVGKISVGNDTIDKLASDLSSQLVPKPETTKHAKGSDLTNVFPVPGKSYGSKLTASDVSSAKIKDNGSTYTITIVIKNETFTGKVDVASTSHGKAMTFLTPNDILTQVENISAISFKSFKSTNTGSTITCTVDKSTGAIKEATYSDNVDLLLSVKALGIINVDNAKINIKTTEKFVMA